MKLHNYYSIATMYGPYIYVWHYYSVRLYALMESDTNRVWRDLSTNSCRLFADCDCHLVLVGIWLHSVCLSVSIYIIWYIYIYIWWKKIYI